MLFIAKGSKTGLESVRILDFWNLAYSEANYVKTIKFHNDFPSFSD